MGKVESHPSTNNVSEEVVRVHPLGLQSDPVVYVRVKHAETE